MKVVENSGFFRSSSLSKLTLVEFMRHFEFSGVGFMSALR
jgi:hypothetical protein